MIATVPPSLPDLARALASGELPLEEYLDRLEGLLREREPGIAAFVPEPGRFERLRAAARELAEAYPDAGARPPLFGVPIGVKDIFHCRGLATRAGSRLPAEELRGPEARSVTALREAGALLLGKTATTEFAYFAPAPTRNPHDPERTPGGSSSGSAAAVAAGLCPLALGTQTIGSISRPAAYCGVVGYKPTYDRISRSGVIPLAPSVDHVGLFATDVAGAHLAASVLVAGWRAEATPPRPRPVLGVPAGPYLERVDGEGDEHFRATRAALETAGFEIRAVPVMADFAAIEQRHQTLVAAEAARIHADWFSRFAALYHPRTSELVRRGQRVRGSELEAALAGRARLRDELEAAMTLHDLDLWLCPAATGAAPRGLESTGDPVMSLPWTHAGLPTLALPAGRGSSGLPLGVQIVGRWQADEELVAWAAALAPTLAGAGRS